MAISKERKQELVKQYRELVSNSRGMVIASYSGITVKELEALRAKIRELGGEFHVVKNTLFQLAIQEEGLSLPETVYTGTTAIGFVSEDIPAMTKAIADVARESDTFHLKGGLVDRVAYDIRQIERLAELPPLPVLRAQLLSVIQLPSSRIAMALAGSIRQIVNVTKAFSESGAEHTTSMA